MMIERIYISLDPEGLESDFMHLALNYLDREGNHHVIEAFPRDRLTGFDVVAEAFKGWLVGDYVNSDSRFGTLVAGERPGDPTDRDLRKIFITQAVDLSDEWRLVREMRDIVNKYGFEYRADDHNSNTFVAEALRHAGLRRPQLARSEVPGYHSRLSDPIDATGEGMFDPKLQGRPTAWRDLVPRERLFGVVPRPGRDLPFDNGDHGVLPSLQDTSRYRGFNRRQMKHQPSLLSPDPFNPGLTAPTLGHELFSPTRPRQSSEARRAALTRREREITRMMRDDRERYFRDEGVQKEFRSIRSQLERMDAEQPKTKQRRQIAQRARVRYYG